MQWHHTVKVVLVVLILLGVSEDRCHAQLVAGVFPVHEAHQCCVNANTEQ